MKPIKKSMRAPVGILADIKTDAEGNLVLPSEEDEIARFENDGEPDFMLIYYKANPDIGDYDEATDEIVSRESHPCIVLHGRLRAANKIMELQSRSVDYSDEDTLSESERIERYGTIRIFRSVVQSQKITFNECISFYTFLRICIMKGIPIGDDGNGSMTIEDLNDFVLMEYEEEANHLGIFDQSDLDAFFNADIAGLDYVPDEQKMIAYQRMLIERSMNL